ncbi:energy transducer TonB [Aliidiomarina iranensis]|uniref:Energy transducer TonB n=1 Tax=Aliidiomarina iranensis TaxID=1434071 RepID=A0A432VQM1_9GAMM|nr:energy transducer TonB [Aliidiomarina iranensis]RUO18500.1 energy transducer TonB [Aliidiomarina iranensis]
MKKLALISAFTLTSCIAATSFNANASNYAHVHLSHLEPSKEESIWLRAIQATPMYPRQLAQRGIIGCAVFNVKIDEAGETESISLESSVPERGIERPVAAVIRSWEWENVSGEANMAEEKQIRLDFCMGGSSPEEAEQLCIAQSQWACSS